jgi:hypothetical protein
MGLSAIRFLQESFTKHLWIESHLPLTEVIPFELTEPKARGVPLSFNIVLPFQVSQGK